MNTQKTNTLTHEETQILLDLLTNRDNARILHFQSLRNPSKDDEIKNLSEGAQLLKIGLKLTGYWGKDKPTRLSEDK